MTAGLPEHLRVQAEERTRERFAACGVDHPFLALLYETSLEHEQRRLARGEVREREAVPPLPDAPGPKLDPVALLRQDIRLPALPQLYFDLREAMDSETSTAGDLAGLISRDAGLSACLLRLVNSAFYGFSSSIDTIPRAVAVVGTRRLSLLAMGNLLVTAFEDADQDLLDLADFWRHSSACAAAARELGGLLPGGDPEQSFVAGLLHDIGRLALALAAPDHLRAALASAGDEPFYEAEARVLGFDHAMFGSMLVRKWNFPFPLVMALLRHHEPSRSKERGAAVIHLADAVAKGLGYACAGGERIAPLDEAAWDSLDLDLEAVRGVLADLPPKLTETFRILDVAEEAA